MGQKISKSKPKKSANPKRTQQSIKKNTSNYDVLGEKFDETLIYQPRTKENRNIYNNFLGQVLSIVQDPPE